MSEELSTNGTSAVDMWSPLCVSEYPLYVSVYVRVIVTKYVVVFMYVLNVCKLFAGKEYFVF